MCVFSFEGGGLRLVRWAMAVRLGEINVVQWRLRPFGAQRIMA